MLYLKALHIIFVVTWFAGLFYIVRLFVYHTEALEGSSADSAEDADVRRKVLVPQYKLMEKRLWYGITWPSAVLTAVFGFWVLTEMNLWSEPYMHLKLLFVALLYGYQIYCHYLFRSLQKGQLRLSSFQLRIWNEGATLFLVSIVFLIVLKNTVDWVYGLAGLILFSLLLMGAIKIYKQIRNKK